MTTSFSRCSTRRTITALAGSVTLLLSGFAASAADVTWSVPKLITNDSDVFVGRSVAGAYNVGGVGISSTVVNGTNFQAFPFRVAGVKYNSDGNFIFTTNSLFGINNTVGSPAAPFSALSSGYQRLLSSLAGTTGQAPFDLEARGLKKGQIYTFQWWINVSGTATRTQVTSGDSDNGNSVLLRTYNGLGSVGEFATGVFVADSDTQNFHFSQPGGYPNVLINGFQLVAGGHVEYNGNFRQNGDGLLYIGLASPENYDQLAVAGNAWLNGKLEVGLYDDYTPKKGKKFTILTAQKGVSGRFEEVEGPIWDNLTLRPFYEDNRVFLKAVVASFAAAAKTPNQHAVGKVLDSIVYDPGADALLAKLYKQDLNQLPGDLDKIAPEELSSTATIATSLAVVQNTNLQRRTDDIRHGSSGFSASGLATQGTGPGYSGNFGITTGVAGPAGGEGKETKQVVVPDERKWGVFLTGVGEWVDVDSDGNARNYDLNTGGFTLGLDYKVTPNFAIGIAAGYAGTSADLSNDGRVWVNGGKLGLYATYFQNTGGGAAGPTGKDVSKETPAVESLRGTWYVDLAVTGGYNSYDTKRGALDGAARGSTDGGELNTLLGTGYDFQIGPLTIGPTATFQYTLVGVDGFTEHGSLAPLNIQSRDQKSLRSTLGIKMTADRQIGRVLVRPELRAAWQHEYGDTSYDISSSFANGAGDQFLVSGPETGRDSLIFGAGVAVQCSETISTYVYYDGEFFRDNYNRHGVSGGVRISF